MKNWLIFQFWIFCDTEIIYQTFPQQSTSQILIFIQSDGESLFLSFEIERGCLCLYEYMCRKALFVAPKDQIIIWFCTISCRDSNNNVMKMMPRVVDVIHSFNMIKFSIDRKLWAIVSYGFVSVGNICNQLRNFHFDISWW